MAAILEVLLLKSVVVRENLRHRMQRVAHRIKKHQLDVTDAVEAREVSSLAYDLRAAGVKVVELASAWRQALRMADQGADIRPPRPDDPPPPFVPFSFDGVSYTEQMVSDMDFLRASAPLAQLFGMEPYQLCNNPLLSVNGLTARDSGVGGELSGASGPSDGSLQPAQFQLLAVARAQESANDVPRPPPRLPSMSSSEGVGNGAELAEELRRREALTALLLLQHPFGPRATAESAPQAPDRSRAQAESWGMGRRAPLSGEDVERALGDERVLLSLDHIRLRHAERWLAQEQLRAAAYRAGEAAGAEGAHPALRGRLLDSEPRAASSELNIGHISALDTEGKQNVSTGTPLGQGRASIPDLGVVGRLADPEAAEAARPARGGQSRGLALPSWAPAGEGGERDGERVGWAAADSRPSTAAAADRDPGSRARHAVGGKARAAQGKQHPPGKAAQASKTLVKRRKRLASGGGMRVGGGPLAAGAGTASPAGMAPAYGYRPGTAMAAEVEEEARASRHLRMSSPMQRVRSPGKGNAEAVSEEVIQRARAASVARERAGLLSAGGSVLGPGTDGDDEEEDGEEEEQAGARATGPGPGSAGQPGADREHTGGAPADERVELRSIGGEAEDGLALLSGRLLDDVELPRWLRQPGNFGEASLASSENGKVQSGGSTGTEAMADAILCDPAAMRRLGLMPGPGELRRRQAARAKEALRREREERRRGRGAKAALDATRSKLEQEAPVDLGAVRLSDLGETVSKRAMMALEPMSKAQQAKADARKRKHRQARAKRAIAEARRARQFPGPDRRVSGLLSPSYGLPQHGDRVFGPATSLPARAHTSDVAAMGHATATAAAEEPSTHERMASSAGGILGPGSCRQGGSRDGQALKQWCESEGEGAAGVTDGPASDLTRGEAWHEPDMRDASADSKEAEDCHEADGKAAEPNGAAQGEGGDADDASGLGRESKGLDMPSLTTLPSVEQLPGGAEHCDDRDRTNSPTGHSMPSIAAHPDAATSIDVTAAMLDPPPGEAVPAAAARGERAAEPWAGHLQATLENGAASPQRDTGNVDSLAEGSDRSDEASTTSTRAGWTRQTRDGTDGLSHAAQLHGWAHESEASLPRGSQWEPPGGRFAEKYGRVQGIPARRDPTISRLRARAKRAKQRGQVSPWERHKARARAVYHSPGAMGGTRTRAAPRGRRSRSTSPARRGRRQTGRPGSGEEAVAVGLEEGAVAGGGRTGRALRGEQQVLDAARVPGTQPSKRTELLLRGSVLLEKEKDELRRRRARERWEAEEAALDAQFAPRAQLEQRRPLHIAAGSASESSLLEASLMAHQQRGNSSSQAGWHQHGSHDASTPPSGTHASPPTAFSVAAGASLEAIKQQRAHAAAMLAQAGPSGPGAARTQPAQTVRSPQAARMAQRAQQAASALLGLAGARPGSRPDCSGRLGQRRQASRGRAQGSAAPRRSVGQDAAGAGSHRVASSPPGGALGPAHTQSASTLHRARLPPIQPSVAGHHVPVSGQAPVASGRPSGNRRPPQHPSDSSKLRSRAPASMPLLHGAGARSYQGGSEAAYDVLFRSNPPEFPSEPATSPPRPGLGLNARQQYQDNQQAARRMEPLSASSSVDGSGLWTVPPASPLRRDPSLRSPAHFVASDGLSGPGAPSAAPAPTRRHTSRSQSFAPPRGSPPPEQPVARGYVIGASPVPSGSSIPWSPHDSITLPPNPNPSPEGIPHGSGHPPRLPLWYPHSSRTAPPGSKPSSASPLHGEQGRDSPSASFMPTAFAAPPLDSDGAFARDQSPFHTRSRDSSPHSRPRSREAAGLAAQIARNAVVSFSPSSFQAAQLLWGVEERSRLSANAAADSGDRPRPDMDVTAAGMDPSLWMRAASSPASGASSGPGTAQGGAAIRHGVVSAAPASPQMSPACAGLGLAVHPLARPPPGSLPAGGDARPVSAHTSNPASRPASGAGLRRRAGSHSDIKSSEAAQRVLARAAAATRADRAAAAMEAAPRPLCDLPQPGSGAARATVSSPLRGGGLEEASSARSGSRSQPQSHGRAIANHHGSAGTRAVSPSSTRPAAQFSLHSVEGVGLPLQWLGSDVGTAASGGALNTPAGSINDAGSLISDIGNGRSWYGAVAPVARQGPPRSPQPSQSAVLTASSIRLASGETVRERIDRLFAKFADPLPRSPARGAAAYGGRTGYSSRTRGGDDPQGRACGLGGGEGSESVGLPGYGGLTASQSMILPDHTGRLWGWGGGTHGGARGQGPLHDDRSGEGDAGRHSRRHSAGSDGDALNEELSGSLHFAGEALLEAQTAKPALYGLSHISAPHGAPEDAGGSVHGHSLGSVNSGNRSPPVKPLSGAGSMHGLDDAVLLETVEETEEAATARSGHLHLGEGRRQSHANEVGDAQIHVGGGTAVESGARVTGGDSNLEMPSVMLEEGSMGFVADEANDEVEGEASATEDIFRLGGSSNVSEVGGPKNTADTGAFGSGASAAAGHIVED